MSVFLLLLLYKDYSSLVTHQQQLGLMTNDDKTGRDFTCIEEKRISQTEDVVLE